MTADLVSEHEVRRELDSELLTSIVDRWSALESRMAALGKEIRSLVAIARLGGADVASIGGRRRLPIEDKKHLDSIDTHALIDEMGAFCRYCGITEGRMSVDHVVPISRGGTHHLSNLTIACLPCNASKSNTALADWLEKRAA